MNVKRYFAPTAREALRALKAELGADAIVLSNKAVENGVEILALAAEDVSALQTPPDTLFSGQAKTPTPMVSKPISLLEHLAQNGIEMPAKPKTGMHPPFEDSIDHMEDEDYRVILSRARQKVLAQQGPAELSSATLLLAEERASHAKESEPHSVAATPAPSRSPKAGLARPVPQGPRGIAKARPAKAAKSASGPTQPASSSNTEKHDGRVIESWSPPRVEEIVEQVEQAQAMKAVNVIREESAAGVTRIEAALLARREEDEKRIAELKETNARLMAEIGSIRGMLERQLAGFAWGEIGRSAPERTRMMGALLEAGFSAHLSRRLTEDIKAEAGFEEAQNIVKKTLNRNLHVLASDADIIDRGGVYALVGPTGVGKTTTTAKLAARCVVRHGASKLALITTDGYRIGAQEQLKIYGRILGVPVFAVKDSTDLKETLAELSGKHMVLIDTVGVCQKDRMVADQAAMLLGAGTVKRLLVMSATARGDTLEDVVRAYDGPDLAGCILSKVDESVSIAPVLDVAVRNELGIFYIANGQRVPEDLHLPNRAYLLHRALKTLPEDSVFRLDEDQAGLLMSVGGSGV
jgi:flagellar biosynthesis protein FlhF